MSIVFTDPKMRKKVSKPFDSELCGFGLPADYNSHHIQTCKQILIKDLNILDNHCSLNSLDSNKKIHFMSANYGAHKGVG